MQNNHEKLIPREKAVHLLINLYWLRNIFVHKLVKVLVINNRTKTKYTKKSVKLISGLEDRIRLQVLLISSVLTIKRVVK